MFSSFFKKAFFQTEGATSKTKKEEAEDLAPVYYEDEETNTNSILYYIPKTYLNVPRLFQPDEWSISDFQVGRHIGKGK
jgi:hypothetical protein